MNNNNIVKIGTALKWRNTFDIEKKYYQENIVTACGCVFRCKVLQAQGRVPVRISDDNGHIVYANTDVWDVLVDMAYYYNYAVDNQKMTMETFDYVKKLDEAFQEQQREIEAIQKDNKDQWDHINAIEKVNDEQQRELNSIFDTISCFSEGIWIDTLIWSNETIWDNNKYAITDDLQNQVNVLTDTHRQDIENLTNKHNSEIGALAGHIAHQEKIQDGINKYLQDQVSDLNDCFSCFGTGVWENNLHWSNGDLWNDNKYAITDALAVDIKTMGENHKKDVDEVNKHLAASDKAFADAMTQNTEDHKLADGHLEKHDGEIKMLQDLINEHDQQIIDLLDTLACFSNGYWDDGLKWSGQALWENSSLMYDTFEDICLQIENHQKAISDLTKEIQKVKSDAEAKMESINETFAGFRKEHEDFRKEHEEFGNEHKEFREEHQAITQRLSDTEENIEAITSDVKANSSAIETNASAIADNAAEIEAINSRAERHRSEYQEMLDDIRAYTGCFEKGEWANPYFWNDTDVWLNTPDSISETENDIISHGNRLTALESQFALFIQRFAVQQTIIEQHKSQLEALMDCFTVLNVGKWQNLLLWDNTSKWSDSLITERSGGEEATGVSVKSYDGETATVSI